MSSRWRRRLVQAHSLRHQSSHGCGISKAKKLSTRPPGLKRIRTSSPSRSNNASRFNPQDPETISLHSFSEAVPLLEGSSAFSLRFSGSEIRSSANFRELSILPGAARFSIPVRFDLCEAELVIVVSERPRPSFVREAIKRDVDDEKLVGLAKMALVGRVSQGFVHDFNNILFSLGTGLDLAEGRLRDLFSTDNPERSELLGLMHELKQSHHLAIQLCERLQTMGSNSHAIVYRDLKVLLDSVALLAKPFISSQECYASKRVRIENNVENGLVVPVIPSEFQMCVLNMIYNAVNHGFAPGSEGKIWFEAREEDDRILLDIGNNGRPIPLDVRQDMFKKRLFSGTGQGLGLYSSAMMVKQFGGQLSVESTPDRTIFTMKMKKPEAKE